MNGTSAHFANAELIVRAELIKHTMRFSPLKTQSFEIPQTATFLLLLLNFATYLLCLTYSGSALAIPAVLLFRNGAMYWHAIERHEYWRLLVCGFLHANLVHLAANMLCLVLWGGLLEKRIGALYFLIVYIGAIVGGSIVGTFTHHTEYLSVGASGGISGILGALLCLWILGKINLSLSFFVMNIGLNIALTMSSSGIDWGAHLGGFAAGLIVCALLDIVEKLNALVFRCKFPEFVKLNSFALLAGFAFYVFKSGQHDPSWQRSPTLAIYAISGVVGLKLLDIVLSRKKGLALVVILFSVANAAVACLLGPMLVKDQCAAGHLFVVVCTNADIAVAALAASICALTIMVCLDALRRGMTDVGFVGATLHAERRRNQGL